MTEMTANARKARNYRARQAELGRARSLVYLPVAIVESIDAAVRLGRYESRQAFLERAVKAFVATEISTRRQ